MNGSPCVITRSHRPTRSFAGVFVVRVKIGLTYQSIRLGIQVVVTFTETVIAAVAVGVLKAFAVPLHRCCSSPARQAAVLNRIPATIAVDVHDTDPTESYTPMHCSGPAPFGRSTHGSALSKTPLPFRSTQSSPRSQRPLAVLIVVAFAFAIVGLVAVRIRDSRREYRCC
jgi:hypothetical protein